MKYPHYTHDGCHFTKHLSEELAVSVNDSHHEAGIDFGRPILLGMEKAITAKEFKLAYDHTVKRVRLMSQGKPDIGTADSLFRIGLYYK